jgi:DNA repair ATPase RecN
VIVLLLVRCTGGEINMLAELGINNAVGIESFRIDDSFFNNITGTKTGNAVTIDAVGIINGGCAGPVYVVKDSAS